MTDTTHLQQALQLHEQWEYEAARQAYAQALAQDPGQVQALYGMGLLLGQHMLRSAEALPYLEAAIGANPRAFAYWRTYINMLIREGLLDMASSLIGMAREQGMQEIALEQLEKDLALARGEEAAAFLEEQAALLPEVAAAVQATAVPQPSLPQGPAQALAQLLQQRKFGPADEKLTALMRQYPRNALLWHARINLEQERGRPAAALQAAAQAVRRLPGDAGLQLLQGELLLESQQPDQAEPPLRAALALQPQTTKIYWLLGDALAAQGKIQEAYPWYVHALLRAEDEGAQIQAQVRLIEALHADGRSGVCAQLLALLMQQPSRSARLYRTGGDVLRTLGWHLQAEIAYRMALQVQPGWRPALIGLHEALNKDASRMAERATCLRQILAHDDLSAELRQQIRSVLADVFFKQGDWSACEQTLDEIQAEDEAAVHAHRLRCWMAMEKNDLEAMDEALRQALAYWPDEHDLMQAQAIYWSRRGDV
ncbi:MAG: tetratricopeptide repeat protein, partial [Comamonas sp.]|nr:tetratricopeptide repeat protein [Comamonas sp.]